MHAGARTHTQILLWVVTDWVNAAINGPLYNVSIQNGGLRVEQVLSQSVGRGKRCNSLLSLLDHWESSASFLHNLCPLWPQRNWGTLPFHIYPFLYKPPHGLFPGLPPLLRSFEKALPHLFPGPLFNSGQLCNNVFNIYRHQPRRYPVRLRCALSPAVQSAAEEITRTRWWINHLNISLAIWTNHISAFVYPDWPQCGRHMFAALSYTVASLEFKPNYCISLVIISTLRSPARRHSAAEKCWNAKAFKWINHFSN